MKKILSLLSHSKTTKLTKDHCHTRNGNGNRMTLRQVLLVAALTILSMSAVGQTYTNTSTCYGTITRSDAVSGKRMHYIKTGPTSGKLLLGFIFGGNNPYANCYSITGYNINDFTIFNDTVYFCGEDANGVGFYGWTRASGLNCTFNVYKLYNNSTTTSSDISRIKVFRSGQDLNVLLIGAYHQSSSVAYRSIFHIKNHGTCTVAYSSVEYFEDIALLDDYVVTIERKRTRDYPHEPHYMRVLNRTSFTLYDALFDYYSFWSQGIESVGNVKLQATDSNNLVSVYCKDSAYHINAYSVSSTGVLSLHKYYTIPTGILPTIGDVAYNSYDKTLAILLNIDTVGTAMFYDCTSYPTITLTSSKYPKIGSVNPPYETKLLSLTNYLSTGFAVTGYSGNKIVFWNTLGSNCGLQRQLSVTSTESSNSRALGATTRNTLNLHYSSFSKSLDPYGVTTQCQTLMPPTPIVGE